eukprot:GEMP01080563.1.p1 GENE.GEMP01080563.1~~GEMP01080563.1.p1  ORF type:complete len:201 (+),score=29.81 GEMP01080563.1:106-708(+)
MSGPKVSLESVKSRTFQMHGSFRTATLGGTAIITQLEADMAKALEDFDFAYDMIDQKKKGYIDRKLGRYWFRALGWCNTDKQLDQMLDYKEDAKAAERWSRIDLADIASKYWSQRWARSEDLVWALKTISGRQDRVRRHDLIRLCTEVGEPLTDKDFSELLQVVGFPPTLPSIRIDELTRAIAAKIESPPNLAPGRGNTQ